MTIRLTKNPISIHPIYSPRTSYKKIKEHDEKMIADMTLNFDKLTINLLKEEFVKKDNELTLPEFIAIAKKHLKFWQVDLPNRQNRLIRYLTYLFNEIDINGNGDMQWDEFTNYIIEKATVLKNLKSKNDQIKHYIRSEISPKMRIDGIIQKMQYIADIDKIAYYEEGSNLIYFINPDTAEIMNKNLVIHPKKLIVNISSVKKEKNGKVSIRKKDLSLPTKVRVLDMVYLGEKKYSVLVVSTSDGYVRGWKYCQNGFILATQPDNEEEMFEHNFSCQIYCLAWDHINEVLYCGQKNGNIFMWNLKTDLQRALSQNSQEGEEDEAPEEKVNLLITSMITMPKLQFMASGRMDGKLILWDTINSKKKWVYNEHSRGILSLAFNETMILLFSAGFDHKICIWNPYISTLIHKIQGHLSPILTLKIIEGTHQLISMDSEGIVKITDTRRFNIISSFSVETESGSASHNENGANAITSFISISKPSKQMLKLVFGGKSMSFYEYDKNYNPFTADENTVISCRYVKETLSFFTPANNKIKVWSALNGDVEKIYMDITPYEISCFDFDFLKKRMVIGDTKGNIALYNTANGAKMKSLTKHAGEVVHLIATQNDLKVDIFISFGLDNEIRISRETEESFEVIRTIYLKRQVEITCFEYCSETKLIMVGTNAGNLAFFDVETGKNAGNSSSQNHEEFTSISKARKEIIISTTSAGRISLIGIPPFPYRFEKLINFSHKDCERQSTMLGVRMSCFNQINNLLYVVDDKMYLSCYSLHQIFEQIDQSELGKQKIQCERKNIVKDIFSRANITLTWQVKAHAETIKSLQFIAQESIVITTSFDKKVKIWNAVSGEFIDSLQQNYNKNLPEALAYYDGKKNYLYTKDRKKAFQNVEISPVQLDFDPFVFFDVTKAKAEHFQETASNKDWKLYVNFKDAVKQEKQQFEKVHQQLNESVETPEHSHQIQDIDKIKQRKIQILERKRKLLKEIRHDNSIETEKLQIHKKDQQERIQKKMSTDYFRRSMIKCIQSIIDKSESQELMETLKNEKEKSMGKKNADYTPIFKIIAKKERSDQEIKDHKQFILDLAKRDTENIINSKKNYHLIMSKDEIKAANKLFSILKTTEGRTSQDNSIKFLCKQNKKQNRNPKCERNELKPKTQKLKKSNFASEKKSSFKTLPDLN